MATYKLKKAEGTDTGKQRYTITVSFEKDGVSHEFDQTVALTKGKTKEEAQAYADEYEESYRSTNQDLASKNEETETA